MPTKRQNYELFTSESVSEGHPDKVADQISDAVLDAIIQEDPHCRVACETLVKTGMVLVAGEIRTASWVDIETIVRQTVKNIGYDHGDMGFDYESCSVGSFIGKQSEDIALGVDETSAHALGAGDQGLMFGYAIDETDVLMPAPITYAHRLMQRQAKLRHQGVLSWLRPDAKSQVTLRYNDCSQPIGVDKVVLSTQHTPEIEYTVLQEAVIEEIIKPVFPADWLLADTQYLVNPTGKFVIGGPQGDCGLTGRKIIVDTYGGWARHGGGAFSGKDPTKVDRTAAYAARYIAKNIVAAGLAKRCEVQLAYAIGVAEPMSVRIDSFGTSEMHDLELANLVQEQFALTPSGMIDMLQLLRPIYQPTASYGHFGRVDLDLTWERIDRVPALQKAV